MYKIYCKLRDERNLKDADVVKATGITKSTFSDWKSGRSEPKSYKRQLIADFFGVSLNYLDTGIDNLDNYSEENAKLVSLIRCNPEFSNTLFEYFSLSKTKQEKILNVFKALIEGEKSNEK